MVSPMSDEQFYAELTYQLTMGYAKKMVEKGLLTKEEYAMFQQRMLELYCPVLSKIMDETLDK